MRGYGTDLLDNPSGRHSLPADFRKFTEMPNPTAGNAFDNSSVINAVDQVTVVAD